MGSKLIRSLSTLENANMHDVMTNIARLPFLILPTLKNACIVTCHLSLVDE